ncbi:hypothetical protein GGR88_001787 [Sphingomonas jejuensis]|uniref:Uncharacterized protein n=1 Tax=Sphingomonas jejuensis TaxID=904715 RepID=A0ABX0XM98_9SPHN|nr:hypothetical protein [Sphingomonas jejuensis]NJC34313.1 hypothetical protein [Sphingomonas jejuensis]
MGAAVIAAVALIGLQPPPVADPDPMPGDDIVVSARPGSSPIDPVAIFRRRCFDPMRRTGQPSIRTTGDWRALTPRERDRAGIRQAAAPAGAMRDGVSGLTFVMSASTAQITHGLVEDRCTLVLIGSPDIPALIRGVTGLMGAGGTTRHVGRPDGSAVIPGWSQRLWSATPPRGSSAGRGLRTRTPGGSWTVVTDPGLFYADRDYVAVELIVREAGAPTAMLVLRRTYRPR